MNLDDGAAPALPLPLSPPDAMAGLALRSILALLLASSAAAQAVYVVDDDGGPGVDFTELQDAVDAAATGDRIEVRAGSYGYTEIRSGLTIMGEERDLVYCEALRVLALPNGETCVLGDMSTTSLEVRNSAGVVLIDELLCTWYVLVDSCEDVRVQGLTNGGGDPNSLEPWAVSWGTRARVVDSFAQFVGCQLASTTVIRSEVALSDTRIWAQHGLPTSGGTSNPVGDPGEDALIVQEASEIWLLRCPVQGGRGGDSTAWQPPGPDGRAIVLLSGSLLHRCKELPAPNSGSHGVGLTVDPGSTLLLEPDLPSMELRGDSTVGGTALMELHLGEGTAGRVYMGRWARRVPFGATIDLLHSYDRGAYLGIVGAGERFLLPFVVPGLPRGTLVHVQGRRVRGDGRTDNSNSVTLLVR